MKKGSFIAGMITMAMLFGLVGTAYAAYQKQATLDYADIKIVLDGKTITPKNAYGEVVEPFAIEGTTYLPVRAISNALGLGVEWDGLTSTVVLTSPKTTSFDECYPDFSVPTLDNIVGMDAYIGLNDLETGDSIAYRYDVTKFNVPSGVNFIEAYEELLEEYGFVYSRSSEEEGIYYHNTTSGVSVNIFLHEESGVFVVLVMAIL